MLMPVPPRVKPIGLYDTTMDGLIVDLFAGGGGASIGIEQAFAAAGIQRHVDIAINHDPDAITCHTRNHPMTDHIQTDVFEVDPVEVTDGKPVRHLHASPDCTDFSRAKGGTPIRLVARRSLAWVVIRWVFALGPANKPRVITLENVPEFKEWGPLRHREGDHGSWLIDAETGNPLMEPDPDQRGECFEAFVNTLRYLGYQVEWRCLSACDYGAPTTRNRLFLIARCDGKPITWPEVTHGNTTYENQRSSEKPSNRTTRRTQKNGKSRRTNIHGSMARHEGTLDGKQRNDSSDQLNRTALKPYLTAADCIDWSEPMCSIFATSAEAKAWAKHHDRPCPRRPLAENTLKRIAAGMDRHVLNSANPYIISIANYGNDYGQTRSVDDPLSTVTAYPRGGHHAVVSPVMVNLANSKTTGRGPNNWHITEPLRTITSGPGFALACPILSSYHGQKSTGDSRCVGIESPIATLDTSNRYALVAAFLNKHYTGVVGQSVEKPIGTVTSWDHHSLGAAHIVKLKGTCKDGQPVTDPLATVQAGGTHYALVASFMAKYYGTGGQWQSCHDPLHTVPTFDRFGLVTVVINGETYAIVDIMMRMLTPRELARAQGFRDDYVIDEGTDGRKLSKRVQVRLIGNSVSPPPMQAIIRANVIPHWPQTSKRRKACREAVTA